MSERNFWLLAAGVAAAFFVGTLLGLPPYAVPVAVTVGLGVLHYWSEQRQVRAYRQPAGAPAPELEERVRGLLTQVGRPDVGIRLVSGAGRPYFLLEDGVLELSEPLGHWLDDEEIMAVLRRDLAVPRRWVTGSTFAEMMAVPLLLQALAGLLWRWTGIAAFSDALLLGFIWTLTAMQTGLHGWYSRRWTFLAYLKSGADAVPYLRASLKLHHEACQWAPPERRRPTANLSSQKHRATAATAGLSQPQLAALAEAAGVPPELYTPIPMKDMVNRALIGWTLVFIVARLYLFVF